MQCMLKGGKGDEKEERRSNSLHENAVEKTAAVIYLTIVVERKSSL